MITNRAGPLLLALQTNSSEKQCVALDGEDEGTSKRSVLHSEGIPASDTIVVQDTADALKTQSNKSIIITALHAAAHMTHVSCLHVHVPYTTCSYGTLPLQYPLPPHLHAVELISTVLCLQDKNFACQMSRDMETCLTVFR
jgi:hypothetical protein